MKKATKTTKQSKLPKEPSLPEQFESAQEAVENLQRYTKAELIDFCLTQSIIMDWYDLGWRDSLDTSARLVDEYRQFKYAAADRETLSAQDYANQIERSVELSAQVDQLSAELSQEKSATREIAEANKRLSTLVSSLESDVQLERLRKAAFEAQLAAVTFERDFLVDLLS